MRAGPVEATVIIKTFAPKGERQKFKLAAEQYVLVMPIGDVHFGSKGWPEQKFKDHISWGLDRGAYFLGMGEFLDLASDTQRKLMSQLRDSARDELDDLLREQADNLTYLLRGTAGRWVGVLEGDHRWDFMAAGAGDPKSVDQYICQALRADFLGTSAVIRVTPNIAGHPEADTLILAHHGIGSSRLSGGQLHRVEDLLKFFEADVYLMGHSHSKVSAPVDRQYLTPDGVHYHRTKILARTGGWMRGYLSGGVWGLNEPAYESRATYVEHMALPPAAMGGLCFGIGAERIEGSDYYRPTLHYSA